MIRALITFYYPDEQNKKNAIKIAEQVDEVIICDNTPEMKESMFLENANIKHLIFGENRGLSKAFNTVFEDKTIEWKEDDYVIFFDQDSDIPENHINNLVNEYEKLVKKNIAVGCIGPVYYNVNSDTYGIPKRKKIIDESNYDVSSIITSSMLCKYKDLLEIGFWNEEIFLDMADWELCFRLKRSGKLCVLTKNATIVHTLGIGEVKVLFLRMGVDNPIREYYQTRDALYMLEKDYAPFRYKLRFLRVILIRPICHLLLLDNKRKRWGYIRRAYSDYKKRISGVYIP